MASNRAKIAAWSIQTAIAVTAYGLSVKQNIFPGSETIHDHKLPNKISSNYIEMRSLCTCRIFSKNIINKLHKQITADQTNDQPIALICVSAIVMQINFVCTLGTAGGTLLYARNFISAAFVTTPVNDTANECPAAAVSAAAPLSQFPGAVERSTLPLACVGPLYNIALLIK
ncbi:hypothetical protein T11_8922 [Trichinella zimbabwensis]|uniref:Uncharacterized protein n=1 Tax=Trichinella zimbabwensis TaxID=268475 RepID=A0A0V1I2F5_9BILA|nr:hypothetical protein T11_8922 [Trichinella zimbabwensis]